MKYLSIYLTFLICWLQFYDANSQNCDTIFFYNANTHIDSNLVKVPRMVLDMMKDTTVLLTDEFGKEISDSARYNLLFPLSATDNPYKTFSWEPDYIFTRGEIGALSICNLIFCHSGGAISKIGVLVDLTDYNDIVYGHKFLCWIKLD